MNWSDGRSFEAKLANLLRQIDVQITAENQVSLIGVSAGASAVINAYAQRKSEIHGVVCICGKLRNPQTAANRFKTNPAFRDSLMMLPESLESLSQKDKQKILSVHPLWDGSVPVADTKIDGALERTVPVLGHITGISYAISFGSRRIAKFLTAPSD